MKTNRNLWPLGIFTAFGLFFAGMASVVVIASTHREHLVNANYYEQELQFQGQIDAVARAQKSGATLAFDASAGWLTIQLPAKHLAQQFSGTVTWYRADTPDLDQVFLLEPRADGTQLFDVTKLAAGPWRVQVAWAAADEKYFLEEKIIVPTK
jgi:hypothetical protein